MDILQGPTGGALALGVVKGAMLVGLVLVIRHLTSRKKRGHDT